MVLGLHGAHRLVSRLLGFVILPAQLPGEAVDLLGDLVSEPLATLKTFSWALVRQLAWQVLTLQKLTLPNDEMLERVAYYRTRYLGRGWTTCPLRTADGVGLDALLLEPRRASSGLPYSADSDAPGV